MSNVKDGASDMYSMPLTMAWFEYQKFGETYSPEDALTRGTLFPELDKPWHYEKRGNK